MSNGKPETKSTPKSDAPKSEAAPAEAPTTAPAAAPKKAKLAKITVRLTGSAGRSLTIRGRAKLDGTAESWIQFTKRGEDGKVKESKKGASGSHANFDAAKSAVEKFKSDALSSGWTLRAKRASGRKDAFDSAHVPGPNA